MQLLVALAEPREGTYAPWQVTALSGLLDTLDRRNSSLAKFAKEADDNLRAGLDRLRPMFAWARDTAKNDAADVALRSAAVAILGRGLDEQQADLDRLASLLVPRSPAELQSAVVAALARLDDPRVPQILLAAWKSYGADLRSQVLEVLLRREAWILALLEEIAAGRVAPGEIDATRRQRLVEYRDETGP